MLCGGGTFSPFSVGLSSQSILNLVTLGEVANILLSNCKIKQMILRYYHIIKLCSSQNKSIIINIKLDQVDVLLTDDTPVPCPRNENLDLLVQIKF